MRAYALVGLLLAAGCGEPADGSTGDPVAEEPPVERPEPSPSPPAPDPPDPESAQPSGSSPESLLTPEERCALEGASAECLVRLAEEVEADDPEHARSLYEQACYEGSTDACDRLGH